MKSYQEEVIATVRIAKLMGVELGNHSRLVEDAIVNKGFITIINLHPKEEPDHPDNHVELYGCISDWILYRPVCCNRYVISCFPLHLNRTDSTCGIRAYVDKLVLVLYPLFWDQKSGKRKFF
ncbi:hypothetical protein Hdeb2414_s0006g00197511 [Helianthus debilis subsp. tardiflorus]